MICARERFYYDILIGEPLATTETVAQIDETCNMPILAKPDDWVMSIVRFQVPMNSIPLFNFRIQSGPLQNDIDLGLYSVTLVNGVNTHQEFVRYQNNNQFVTPPLPPSSNPPLYLQDVNTRYYELSTVQHMLDMVNAAIQTASTAVGILIAPYFIYEPNSAIISLMADIATFDDTVPGFAELYVNNALIRFFQSMMVVRFGYNVPLGKSNRIVIHSTKNNTIGTDYKMSQTYAALSDWSDVTSVVFVSNTIPTRPEQTPALSGPAASIKTSASSNILADFVLSNADNVNQRGTLTYIPSGENRRIDLVSPTELRRINISLYWTDRLQYGHLIYIEPYEQITVKCLFEKKYDR